MSDSDAWPRSFSFKKFRRHLSRLTGSMEVDAPGEFVLSDRKIRVPLDSLPLRVSFEDSKSALDILPEAAINERGKPRTTGNLLLVAAKDRGAVPRASFRLSPGQSLTLGSDSKDQKALLGLDSHVGGRHFRIKVFDDEILFKNLLPERKIAVTPLDSSSIAEGIERRVKALRRLRKVIGRRIEPLAEEPALQLLQKVNDLLSQDSNRPTDLRGMPGGVVSLPKRLIPVIVGDLHARIDNLLVVLSQPGLLEALEDKRASLIVLGDAVHPEAAGDLGEMDSSMAIMDLLFTLKLRFPEQLFYLRGNHDSFADSVQRDTVKQGTLWRRKLKETRGKGYLKEMERYYDLIPYIAYSKHFVACHAGAPKTSVNRDMLINIRHYPALETELTENRLVNSKGKGYSRADVKRFRKGLDLGPDIPFIVGHTPPSQEDTLWMNVGEIAGHHLVYSGGTQGVGAATFIDGHMVPLRYPTEPLLELFNSLPS